MYYNSVRRNKNAVATAQFRTSSGIGTDLYWVNYYVNELHAGDHELYLELLRVREEGH